MKRQTSREVSDTMLVFFGLKISHVTVCRWFKKFVGMLRKFIRLIATNFTRIWHVDEKYIKVRGSKDDFAYLWVVCDNKSKILATHISNRRDIANAKIILRKARELSNPEIIVTDGLQSYKKACRIFGRKVSHLEAHFEGKYTAYHGEILKLCNNRIERINSDIDLFLHGFRGLKSFESAQIWIDGFMIYHNYLKPSSVRWHLIPKMLFNRREKEALAVNWIILSPFQLTVPV
jgi:transposase-like protein